MKVVHDFQRPLEIEAARAEAMSAASPTTEKSGWPSRTIEIAFAGACRTPLELGFRHGIAELLKPGQTN